MRILNLQKHVWKEKLKKKNFFFFFSSIQSLSQVQLFVTPEIAALQAFLSTTNSQSLVKLMPIESMMPSNHLILCHPLLLPSIFPCIRIFSNESVLCIRWPKFWSFSFSISPSSAYSEMIPFIIDWFDLLAVESLVVFFLFSFFRYTYKG